jgi:23S rRNA pseudouridine1911/1915/1917 synthase
MSFNSIDPTSEPYSGFTLFEFKADAGQQALRIDKFIVNFVEGASRSKVQQAIAAGHVLVNEKTVKANYKVRAGDEVKVMVEHEPETLEIIPEEIPLDVLFEDEHILVINKQAGLVVHPGVGNKRGTLMNALAYRFEVRPDFRGKRPWLVHRIDKNTSGLLVIAKSDEAMAILSSDFKSHSIERSYVALVWGVPEPSEGTINRNLARDQHDRKKYTVVAEEQGKQAITHYKLLEDYHFASLLECRLETGRTHQIRVHMKSLGHPLFNDEKYGGNRILKGVVFSKYKQFVDNCFKELPRQALHARSLGFQHPITKEHLSFTSPLPEDMKTVIDKWRTIRDQQNFG